MSSSSIPSRKQQHVELTVREEVEHRRKSAGFEPWDFVHDALPELSLNEIELRSELAGRPLRAPLVISSMTGGYAGALEINRSLAQAAENYGIAMGLGSGRQALANSEHERTFSVVREVAPNAVIFANIGGVEVANLYRDGKISSLDRIIRLCRADALAIHLNPLQELMQPEGSHDFRGVLAGIRSACSELGLPIIVKEVGAGISKQVAERLLEAGVQVIDVAGAGGTSWAGVEILRNGEDTQGSLEPFWDWGIPTAEALLEVATLRPQRTFGLIASGGIRDGVEIAKAIAMGADQAALARPFIQAVTRSGESGLERLIDTLLHQLRVCMLLTGSRDLAALRQAKLVRRNTAAEDERR